MYQVYCDGFPIHDLRSEELVLNNNPSVTLADNDSGSFQFTISPKHPHYNDIKKLKSEITVLHNGVEIFCGRPTEEEKDFYNNKRFFCKGELNYLADSIQRPAEYHNKTVRGFLEALVEIHNAQVIEGNVAITFNANCKGESANFDYLELYYVQNGKVFKALSRYRADNLAGRTFVVPTLDFYVYWHSDGSVNNFYGFSIDSATMTDGAALIGTEVSSLPAYNAVQTSNITAVQTAHNPYLNTSNMLWHYTHIVPDNFVGKKTFKVGAVTVVDSNDSLYRYTNYENTLDCIKEKLVKRLGGHIRIRKANGIKYLDYLADYPVTSDQVIEFGRNLLDFSQTLDAQDIATAIIPLGAKLEESTIEALDERLTIKSVNNDCDFIFNQAAVDTFGWVFKTVTFDAVTVPSNLKRKGEEYLSSVQFESLVLDVTAVDLNNVNVDISRIHLLDRVRVKSEPHGLDSFFPVTKLIISLEKPESDKIVLGSENAKVTMTGSNSSTKTDIMERIENIPSESSILKEAIDNATALINSATHGFVVTTANEQLIMDTNDTETASKVWRWNLNGLGYSNTGYKGTYTTAITMDGQIVGERLVGGSVSAEKLSVEYKYSVERAIELAKTNANDATDNKLKSYYTKTQVTTAIKNSADSVLISAKEEAVEYTDSRLTAYATKAEIKVKTDSIESTVSKKLNSSEFTTKLTQNYSYVRIAWNKCSQYIQFENSSLNIYDYNNYKLMSLNSSGSWFYREGSTIGMIGTSQWSDDSSYKGLVFELENTASYMCWAAKDSNNASSYTVKLIYHHKTSKAKKGLHFSCDTYADSCLYLTDSDRFLAWSSGGCGYNGEMSWVNKSNNTAVAVNGVSKKFTIYNGVSIDFYSNLDMHGYSIKNQSDARMKKDIHPTGVKALEILNAIDLKEFKWVQTDEFEPIGIIAQQLQLIAPELVTEEKDGHLSIQTTKFIFYLIKAVQELSGDNYEKLPWVDPFTLVEKKAFCAKLNQESVTPEEKVVEPIKIPIRK